MDCLEVEGEQHRQALLTWLCPACKSPRPGTGAVNLTVENHGIRNKAALTFAMGVGVPIARRDVLFSLGTERVFRDFWIGQVFKRNGTPVDGLVTFRGRSSLIVRGSKHVSYRKCPECGNSYYFAMIGDRYLHRTPPEGPDLFQSQFLGVILPDQLFKTVNLAEWVQVTHEVLPVLDPEDGLGDLGAYTI
jgi:rubredoxin